MVWCLRARVDAVCLAILHRRMWLMTVCGQKDALVDAGIGLIDIADSHNLSS
jgi:hypothetical protein